MTIPLERDLPPDTVHTRVREAHHARRGAERALAFYLKEVEDRRLFQSLGYESIRHYAHSIADLTARQTRELLRIAGALETLPQLAEAYSTGSLPYTAVREITRVATRDSETAWIAEASRLSCRQVERLVARARAGDTPEEARRRACGEGVGYAAAPLVLRVRPHVKDIFERALRIEMRATGATSVEEALLSLAQRCLSPPGDHRSTLDGPRFRVVLFRCEECDRATFGKDGPEAPVALVAQAECDGEVVNLAGDARVTRAVPPRVRRAVLLRHGEACAIPGCKNRVWLAIHHYKPRSRGGTHDPENLTVLCSRHHAMVHEGWLGPIRTRGKIRWYGKDGVPVGQAPTHGGRDPTEAPARVGKAPTEAG